MNANEAAGEILDTGLPLARLSAVQPLPDGRLEVTWSAGPRAGLTDHVDVTPVLGSYKIFRPLRDNSSLFATARLIEDGFVVGWDGPDLEMTAEVIERCADETMSPAGFAEFLRRNKLTQEQAAALLGRSRRQIGYYLKPGPVPRIVALACFGYEALAARREAAA